MTTHNQQGFIPPSVNVDMNQQRRRRFIRNALLVMVVAIIGILLAVAFILFNSTREESRDEKRIADIEQIQRALERYADAEGEYPDALSKLTDGNFISLLPEDPLGDSYTYDAYVSPTVLTSNDCTEFLETCRFYHLGASFEDTDHPALDSDADITGHTVDGDDADGCNSGETDRACYDVTP